MLDQCTKDRDVHLFKTIYVPPLDFNIVENKKQIIPISFRKKLSSHLVREINVPFYTFFVMPRQNKRAVLGAMASCISHFIHPSTPIR